jgi:hypothetical protein
MDIKDIFRDFRDPTSSSPHPTSAIIHISKKLSPEVQAKYKYLRAIVFSHPNDLITSWREKTTEQRAEILKKAWPQIPSSHRPEAFDGGKSPKDYIG